MNTPATSVDVAGDTVIIDFTELGIRSALDHEEAFQLHAQLGAALAMLGPRAEAEGNPEEGHEQ